MLARLIVRRRGWIAAAWIAAAALLLPAAARVERTLDVAARITGSESAAVEEVLRTRFASPYAKYAILVVSGVPAPIQPAGRHALQQIVAVVGRAPGVTRTFSWLDEPDPLFLGRGRPGTFVMVGLEPGDGPADALIPGLRAASAGLEHELRPTMPGVALRWTGEIALNHDLRRTSASDARAAEQRALPVTLALLIAAFGALAAALLPVLAAVLAIALALGAAVALSPHLHLSILLQNVVSMLGLGLGIDYALLMVTRFREARALGLAPSEAAEQAARRAGGTIALSGLAVAIGFAALFVVPLNELRSVAVGGLLVTAMSVLLATTLLPGILCRLGPRVDLGRMPWRRKRPAGADRWRAWGRWVAAHPWAVLIVAGFPLLALALQSRRLNTELPRGDWLPPHMESARAIADLDSMGRSAVVQSIRIVMEFPDSVAALGPEGWSAVTRLGDALAADPRVRTVRSLPVLAGGGRNATLLSLLPDAVRRSFVSADGHATLIDLVAREGVEPPALTRLVRELRAAEPAALTGFSEARLRIGGLPAFNADYQDAVAGRFRRVVALVLAGTLLVLFAGFRSVLVPIKAVVLNLLSVAGAFGAIVLVFQDGHGAHLLGAAGATGGVFAMVPILVFCTVFGLSMDYEVFLVARIAEARSAGADDTEALAEGLARTGGVITSAAAIMIAVFAAFAFGDFLFIKMLGFALATAVLLDATVVRVAIGPALMCLAGRWNWWPGGTAVSPGREPSGEAAEVPALVP